MSHWNYRIIRGSNALKSGGVMEWYGLHEVYYDDDGNPDAWIDSPTVVADSVDELKNVLQMMLKDIERSEKDVLEIEGDKLKSITQ